MNIIDTLKKRTSVRTYDTEKLNNNLLDSINNVISKKRIGPYGNEISFMLVNTKSSDLEEIGKMSSYGVIKGAQYYIGGFCEPNNETLYDYGYCLEEIMLELTELNFGTCWLGGTFNRSFISKAMNLPDGKVIPAITPVGIPMDKLGFSDKLVRFIAKSDKRKDNKELFFNNNFDTPISELTSDNFHKILEMVKIGPSASNKQPWRVIVVGNNLELYWDYDEKYNSMIKLFNIQALDLGIAICHIRKAAEALGLNSILTLNNLEIGHKNWIYVASISII